MRKKLHQITDGIHKTIYLSELEYYMMSTAFFYRLHDVYQSSTVYLAFPCNRTKRYEHSCGTMDVAGKMFFSAITNANENVLDDFFSEAEKRFFDIVEQVLRKPSTPSYCESGISSLSKCFKYVVSNEIKEETAQIVKDAYDHYTIVADPALDHYMPPFSEETNKRKFLYQCLLEAIRIVSLFHDVGHPPYSHIIEKVLIDLYNEVKEDRINNTKIFNPEKANELMSDLSPYIEKGDDGINSFLSSPKANTADLHEQIGLKMLNKAFDDVYKDLLENIHKVNGKNRTKKSTLAIYYTTVAEFCISILREQDNFFVSLHRIIDGCIDADRMDYVVRDSRNSGVNWGVFPYKRLLESCKLTREPYGGNKIINQDLFFVSFPEKMSEDIDDLLISRYKIFSRINYHHRSYKTAMILQRLVYALSKDFLTKNKSEKTLCDDISDLWCCLYSTLSSNDLYIIQWNDSTLISHLYRTLVQVKKNSNDDYGINEEHYEEILTMLEEFLLNKKHFYSVFKRESDLIPIYENVFSKLQPNIEKVKKYIQKNLKANPTNTEARGTYERLDSNRLSYVIKTGDIETLERLFPVEVKLNSIVNETLTEFKDRNKITFFLFDENPKWKATGLPKKKDMSDSIFLYSANYPKGKLYNIDVLQKQISLLQNYCLRYIAYIKPGEGTKVDDIIKEICGSIENHLYEQYVNAIDKYFNL